ncbi:MAG TPA: hypothetical protein VNL13_03405 [Sulfolobales archaeon]|nr:hypothetical protein [Sulfolobales archaeon]
MRADLYNLTTLRNMGRAKKILKPFLELYEDTEKDFETNPIVGKNIII